MSFPTRTPSGVTAPLTSSSSSVVTAVKASLGSPFFHARLQEGQRIDDSGLPGLHYEVSAFSLPSSGVSSAGSYSRKQSMQSGCEGQPRASRGHAAENSAHSAVPSPSSKLAPTLQLQIKSRIVSVAAMPMPADDQDFWAMVADAQNPAPPTARRNHYITRSQSVDAGTHHHSPKMRKQNASYSAAYGSPMYQAAPSLLHEVEPREPEPVEGAQMSSGAPAVWMPMQGRHLSPIEEVNTFPERHGDTASLHSTTSAQSHLFINRPVRRTPSTTSFNSANSTTPRSQDDTSGSHGTSPSRSHGHPRPFPASLPVIPASPRESQNVFESDSAPCDHSVSLAFPMPVILPPQVEYSAFQPPDEEHDLGGFLSPPLFAVPRSRASVETLEEQDLGEPVPAPRLSVPRSSTPSLIARSESVRTELTYLTAQDSAPGSRRASAVLGGADLEAGRHHAPPVDGDTTLVEPSERKAGPGARLKASFDTLLSKSSRKPAGAAAPATGGGSAHANANAHADAHSKWHARARAKWPAHVRRQLTARAPWRASKPAEVLFWTGFLAPWCWLIGGWMLARSGHTLAAGLPSGAKEPAGLPVHSAGASEKSRSKSRSRSGEDALPARAGAGPSVWEAAKNSSAELLASLRGERAHEEGGQLRGDVPVLAVGARADPWVTRCRVAAVVSGMFILALCIVALIVLIRSL